MDEPARTDPWADAHREADTRALGYVGTDLLLLALARSQGTAGDVLRELGATPAAMTAIIDQLNADRDAAARPETDEKGRPRHVRPTPAAEHARGRANGLAIGLGERESSVHLLLALAYDRSGIHNGVLRHVGVSRSAIVESLKARRVTVPPNPPPRDPDPMTQAVILPDADARVVVAELGRRSIADRTTYFDEEGHGRWGYGGVPDRPGDARLSAQAVVDLRGVVKAALEEAGLPQPSESDWESFTPL